ncbi:MAG: IS1634 family transposase [Verrucomicrobia bacterium]|nr:IS1634 family transposase [Verrucomicrobiota bacterium]
MQICECYRVGDKVKQKVVRHVGISNNDSHLEELKKLALALKRQLEEEREGPFLFEMPVLPEESAKDSLPIEPLPPQEKHLVNIEALKEEKRIVDGFHDVFGTLFDQLGFHHILSGPYREILREVVLARIASPTSKMETQQVLAADFGRDIALDRIYRMMDALIEQKAAVQRKVFSATEQLCFGKIEVLLFDVTTLYFESTAEDELRAFGYSKDQKFHSTQVVLALATAPNGLPFGYQLFPGNTADVSTLLASLEAWKAILSIGRVRFVADRAMMSEKNLSLLEASGIEYVVAAKLKTLPSSLQEKILQSPKEATCSMIDQSLEETKRRLIVTFCPSRQAKDEGDRRRILQKIHKKIGKGKSAKKLVSNSGYQKYLSLKGESSIVLDAEKIARDAAWDGFHGIITNCSEETAEELLSQYRRLWVIEESFRIQKHNLSIRPIYHFKSERIEAHILICYMAFTLMRHLEFRVEVQKEKISMRAMREELWRVQSSYLHDCETPKKYRMPSKMGVVTKKLYQVMGIKRFQTVTEM